MNIKELIEWSDKVTDAFQNIGDIRYTFEDVMRHHGDELREFADERYIYSVMTNANIPNDANKKKLIDEFWDCMFTVLMYLSIDEAKSITHEEWLEGFKRTVIKVNGRAMTNG